MVYKINIGFEGKSWKIEAPEETLSGKALGDKIDGKDVKPELEGYQLEIAGASDKAGFPLYDDVEGIALQRVLFTKGWGMKDSRPGIRIKKTVRGKTLSDTTVQVNLKVIKTGKTKLAEIFPEQNKAPEPPKEEAKAEAPKAEEKPAEAPAAA